MSQHDSIDYVRLVHARRYRRDDPALCRQRRTPRPKARRSMAAGAVSDRTGAGRRRVVDRDLEVDDLEDHVVDAVLLADPRAGVDTGRQDGRAVVGEDAAKLLDALALADVDARLVDLGDGGLLDGQRLAGLVVEIVDVPGDVEAVEDR